MFSPSNQKPGGMVEEDEALELGEGEREEEDSVNGKGEKLGL